VTMKSVASRTTVTSDSVMNASREALHDLGPQVSRQSRSKAGIGSVEQPLEARPSQDDQEKDTANTQNKANASPACCSHAVYQVL